ncbi:S41 family peptidase [Lutimonas halocynthiae]|uniref:S41 family peptidase n=1 Tax=Lutimonas halocynthiae TaxID=1446477 RepID=UPI0025B541A6|nr:S41 family peptidase [Lutimonas halocynthiae]
MKRGIVIGSLVIMSSFLVAFKSDFFEVAKQMEIYTTLFKELNLYYIDEINPAELTEKAINEMLEDLDPYTRYYDEQGVEEVKINSSGEYSGIGAESHYYDKKLVISEVFEGYSAEEEGIKVGDEIVKIDDILVDDYDSDQISALLKGVPDTTVKLVIKRQKETLDFTVKREKILVNPVPHFEMVSDEIGYIAFNKFNNKASASVKSAFADLKEKGMNKLILDLRGNPGGLLNEAINITNFFVPKNEVVVSTKAKLKKWSEIYRTRYEPIDLDMPIVVLIDGRSASASEIVAGSLQDLDRAVILGERSFGKGLVQRYRNLTYGTKLKLTISKYYTPSGRNIQELDYTHRDGDDVPKFAEENRNAFKTKNGRTVYDGGGISPDIEIEKPELTESTEALLRSDAIFNFASVYYLENPSIAAPEAYIFEDKEYEDFISFVEEGSSNFETKTEKKFEQAFELSEKEALSKGIKNSYEDLVQQLQKQKIEELNKNKESIKELLSDEIINRYYFKKGEYQNHIAFSPFIKEAISVLENDEQYRSILLNGKN